jgi:hypothetical protein
MVSASALSITAVGVHVAEQGDLLLHALLHGVLRAAHQDVRLHAQAEQLLHAVLGGLGLQFAARAQVGQEGEVDGKASLPFSHFNWRMAST